MTQQQNKLSSDLKTFADNMSDWACIHYGKEEAMKMCLNSDGISKMISDYNSAYEAFYLKIKKMLPRDRRELEKILGIQVWRDTNFNSCNSQIDQILDSIK